jgi:hypothetical protein
MKWMVEKINYSLIVVYCFNAASFAPNKFKNLFAFFRLMFARNEKMRLENCAKCQGYLAEYCEVLKFSLISFLNLSFFFTVSVASKIYSVKYFCSFILLHSDVKLLNSLAPTDFYYKLIYLFFYCYIFAYMAVWIIL